MSLSGVLFTPVNLFLFSHHEWTMHMKQTYTTKDANPEAMLIMMGV